MMLLEPNRDQIEIFVQALFRYVGKDGFISMRAFYENDDSDKPVRITPTSLAGGLGFVIDVAEDDARRAANQPRATVFCPPVAVFNNKDHAREVDLLIGPALVVECDEDPQQARVKLEQLLGTATLVVRSGGQWTNPTTEQVYDRVHLYWRLAQGAKGDNLEKLKRARKLATYLVGGDTTNVPICHPIRWPGSWHCKNAPRLCEIVELHPDCEIDLDRALVVLTTAAPNVSTTKSGDPGRDDGEALDWSKSFGEIITGEHFHPTLVPLAASFAAHGLPELAARGVLRALLDSTQTKDPERLRRRDTELGKLRDTVHSGYKKFAAAVPTDTLLDPWAQAQLPDFPLATLPVIVGRFVERQSLIIGGCPSAMALSVLCALSGAIDHRFKVKMMRHGDWEARPRLWGLLVGDPSKKKTPIINAAARPLERWQRRLWREYQAQLRDHIAAGGKADDEDAPQEPLHYVVYDTTIEALGDALAKSSRGVLVKRDELAGWIASMERYGGAARGGSDRGFWLQVYDGEGYGFLRIKRGNIPISDFSVSILGGIQPARLAELQGLTSDGLLQRFLVAMISMANRGQDIESNATEYGLLVERLLSTPRQRLELTEDALACLNGLLDYLYSLEQMGDGGADGFQSFVGKLAGYAGSLATILHVAEEHGPTLPNFIGSTIIKRVDQIIREFVIPHGHEFYRLGGAAEQLKQLASFILTSDLERFRAADLASNVRDLKGQSLVTINERLSPLIAGGWLDPADRTQVCRVWTLNPSVRVRFADRRRTEVIRKKAVTTMLRERRAS
ncbi:MAG TPA: DUF3987 domain-containing protein [Bradyrhizobium sp.]|jgi:hypothetical protein|nr:DUF3987 domain-containing protein [Bradyrhizobium sp.]